MQRLRLHRSRGIRSQPREHKPRHIRKRRARQHVVMASAENMIFDEPVRVGELIECVASIARVGRSSMTVSVDLVHEDALTGLRRSAVRGTFEMVAVDTDGRPAPVFASQERREIPEEAVP